MAPTGDGGDIARLICEQHATIRELLARVPEERGVGRRLAFDELAELLAAHEAVEERVLYPRLRSVGLHGGAVADDRRAEEATALAMLARLGGVDVEGDAFAPAFAVLRSAVLRHAEREEQIVLPLLAADPPQPAPRSGHVAVGGP
ncbi:MAG TPA: hemerythrin domain-containing protein [Acidimicrobiales bacterium]